MEVTWKQLYSGRLPKSTAIGDIWTMFSFVFLREELVAPESPLLGGFMKWGIDFLKDTIAIKCFSDAKQQMRLNDKQAAGSAGNVLKQVDWDLIQKVFEEGAASYTAYCQFSGDGDKIQPYLDGLTYQLTLKEIPGVREPGDLFKRLTSE